MQSVADEFRTRRLSIGVDQAQVGSAVGISRSTYSRIENGKLGSLSIVRAAQIGTVLGLDISVRAYPGGGHIRDEASQRRLDRLVSEVAPPLAVLREAPLPQKPGARLEQRAWDLMLSGIGLRTAMELEMRLHDVQALERRVNLKLRDDPVDRFVLLVADTRTNRMILDAHDQLLGLPRLLPSVVFKALRAGRHPPSGIVLI